MYARAAINSGKRDWHGSKRRHGSPLGLTGGLIDGKCQIAAARLVGQPVSSCRNRHIANQLSIPTSNWRERPGLDDDLVIQRVDAKAELAGRICHAER